MILKDCPQDSGQNVIKMYDYYLQIITHNNNNRTVLIVINKTKQSFIFPETVAFMN